MICTRMPLYIYNVFKHAILWLLYKKEHRQNHEFGKTKIFMCNLKQFVLNVQLWHKKLKLFLKKGFTMIGIVMLKKKKFFC